MLVSGRVGPIATAFPLWLSLPNGCQEGLCATCFAKVLPRPFKCFNYFSSPFWFTFLKNCFETAGYWLPFLPTIITKAKIVFWGGPILQWYWMLLEERWPWTTNCDFLYGWVLKPPIYPGFAYGDLLYILHVFINIFHHDLGNMCFCSQPPYKQIWVKRYTIWIMHQPSPKLIDPLYMDIMSWMVVGKQPFFWGGEGPWSYRKCRKCKNSGAWRMGSYS